MKHEYEYNLEKNEEKDGDSKKTPNLIYKCI